MSILFLIVLPFPNGGFCFVSQLEKTTELSRRERFFIVIPLLFLWLQIAILRSPFFLVIFLLWVFHLLNGLVTIVNFSCSQRRNRETESPWKVYEAPRTRENRASQERFRYILKSLFIYFGQWFYPFFNISLAWCLWACLYFC